MKAALTKCETDVLSAACSLGRHLPRPELV